MPSMQLLSGVMVWRGINTENSKNSTIRRGNLKGHKPLLWISFSLSDTVKTPMKLDKQSFCATISRWEKDGGQPLIFYVVCLIVVDMISVKYWSLYLGLCKIRVQDPASSDIWSHWHWHISSCNHWKIRKKLFSFIFPFIMKIKEVF